MARLILSFLGPFQVTLDGRVVTGFESNKVRALLAYLSVESDRLHARESLAALLWPNFLNHSAVNNLRSVLANLRQVIGDAVATPPFLIITRDTIQFNSTADFELDVNTFKEAAASPLEQAHVLLGTYRGDFLEGFSLPDNGAFEEWLQDRREHFGRQMLESLGVLTAHALEQFDYDEAMNYARRQLAMDILHESAHRQLMRALALSGRRAEALAQYEACVRVLRNELNVLPSAHTRALAEQIAGENLSRRDSGGTPPAPEPVSASAPRYLLPQPLSSFIGRRDQLASLVGLLTDSTVQLITVTGPGGVGKTRLAQEAARRSGDTFRHGVYFIPLESAGTTEEVILRMMAGLGIQSNPSLSPEEAVLNLLQNMHALLVLDTYEHLLPETDIIERIRAFCPDVKLMVTSRSVLRLSGEHLFIVPPLSNPVGTTDPVEIVQADAVALFEARVREIQPEFAISRDNVSDVVEICRVLDGLPLALEMAAANIRTLSLRQLRKQLSVGVELLAGGPRDAPMRHRNLQDTLSWSYDLLSPAEQALFRRLGIFAEGCTFAAAEAIALGPKGEESQFIDQLSGLIDQSLVQVQKMNGRRIYRLHEVTRRYAHDLLVVCGELDESISRLLDYMLYLAQQVNQHFHDSSRNQWLTTLEPEDRHVWLALEWGLSKNDRPTVIKCLALTGNMLQYWNIRGQHDLARQWTERALDRACQLKIDDPALGQARITAASMALVHADINDCLSHAEAALHIAQGTGDLQLAIRARHLSGLCAFARDELDLAGEIWDMALAQAEQLGDPLLLTIILDDLGNLAARRGRYEEAIEHHLREQIMSLEAGDLYSEFYADINLGEVSMLMERPADAELYYGRALKLCRELGDSRGLAQTMITQAALLVKMQRMVEARQLLTEVIRLAWAIQNLDIVMRALEMMIDPAVCDISPATRARLTGAIFKLNELYSSASLPVNKEYLTNLRDSLREQMDPSTFALEWRIGQTQTWEQVVNLALAAVEPVAPVS